MKLFWDMAVRIFHDNSQQYYFKYSYTRRTFYYSVDIITYWFYLLHKFKVCSTFTGTFFRKISEQLFRKPEFRKVLKFQNNIPEISSLREKIVPEFRIYGTFSMMEMEKISGSFP